MLNKSQNLFEPNIRLLNFMFQAYAVVINQSYILKI